MKHRKPQKGNPHRLTINQHALPTRSLQRFANLNGFISVLRKDEKREFLLRPDNNFFCAMRSWDQRAEHGYMKSIEDGFQPIADQIVNGLRSLDDSQQDIISKFYALWRLRAEYKINPLRDITAVGIEPDNLTINQQEILEKNGYISIGKDAHLPGWMLAGIKIQVRINFYRTQLKEKNWGIITTENGEFIIPDYFGTFAFVPISPTKCLMADYRNTSFSENDVGELNRYAISQAKHYVIARSFARCPK